MPQQSLHHHPRISISRRRPWTTLSRGSSRHSPAAEDSRTLESTIGDARVASDVRIVTEDEALQDVRPPMCMQRQSQTLRLP